MHSIMGMEKKQEDKVLSLKKWVDFVVSRALGTVVDTAVLWFVGWVLHRMVAAHPASGFWSGFQYWGEYWIGPAISLRWPPSRTSSCPTIGSGRTA